MKISIITVCLNSEKTIERTIQSVICQEGCDYEYIIIDGKSADSTLDIIEKYKYNISVVISEPDSGIYDAMNKGIDLATGDVIGIINSDDWYEQGVFEQVEKCFQDTDVEVVYGEMNLVGLKGETEILVPRGIEGIRYEMVTPHPTVFIKKEIYKKYGTFQLKYKIAADYELILRLYTAGVKFKYLKRVLANFCLGGISIQQAQTCAKETVAIASQYLSYAPLEKRQHLKDIIFHRKKAYLFEKTINNCPVVFWNILSKELGVGVEDNIVIFGAGKWGKKVQESLLCVRKRPLYIVDNDRTKWNQEMGAVKIVGPDILETFKGVLLVVVEKFCQEISLQVSKLDNPSIYCVYWEEISERILCMEVD